VRLLIDTHVLIWWLLDEPRLSRTSRELLASSESEIFVSAASAMEIATKHRLGKLPHAAPLVADFGKIVAAADFIEMPITARHAIAAGSIRHTHADPFDRFLAAQATIEQISLMTSDETLRSLVPASVW
jgi:PIN domain nuclease of toxin-antitoxin system